MIDREKREKVIKGLECCVRNFGDCENCSYDEGRGNCGCRKQLYADALALLKAQEPRVMTLEEMFDWDGAVLIEDHEYGIYGWLFFVSVYEHAGITMCEMMGADGDPDRFKQAQYGKT